MKLVASLVLFFLAFTAQVDAHAAILGATGLNGVKGRALGIVESTPRDCTQRNPCQQDSSIIDDREIASGRAGACGRTLAGGNIDMDAEVQKILSEAGGLPSVAPGQPLTLEVHQVNADGAGPFTCEVDATATGKNFQNLEITTNVPGNAGRDRAGQKTTHPLTVQMPQNLQCTGGPNGNMCMVRCRNPIQGAGPFGGCVPVEMGNGKAAPAPPAGKAPVAKTPANQPAPPANGAKKNADAAKKDNTGAKKAAQKNA
ncbi:hypothetical protein BKA69DRAFT_1091927 [Paraphysoderma sedebokerense]|nr:hypothetical protein BKA69DRAFT_1091927 [Paraphysoderma sedebokerense]